MQASTLGRVVREHPPALGGDDPWKIAPDIPWKAAPDDTLQHRVLKTPRLSPSQESARQREHDVSHDAHTHSCSPEETFNRVPSTTQDASTCCLATTRAQDEACTDFVSLSRSNTQPQSCSWEGVFESLETAATGSGNTNSWETLRPHNPGWADRMSVDGAVVGLVSNDGHAHNKIVPRAAQRSSADTNTQSRDPQTLSATEDAAGIKAPGQEQPVRGDGDAVCSEPSASTVTGNAVTACADRLPLGSEECQVRRYRGVCQHKCDLLFPVFLF